ncbi:MAG: hypothetical protein WCT28_03990 [Patescibacteria group bacterium]
MSGIETKHGLKYDWKSDESAENKRTVIEELFRGVHPSSLCFDLRGLDSAFTDEDVLAEAYRVFDYKGSESAKCTILPHESIGGGRTLQVVYPQRNNGLLKLMLRGQDCHLFYVERACASQTVSFSFVDQWEKARFLPGTRVRVRDRWRSLVVRTQDDAEDSLVFHWGESATLTIKQTLFTFSRNRASLVAGFLLGHPELADLVLSLIANESKVVGVSAEDLEVVDVCVSDSHGLHSVRICAYMLEEIP